MVLPALRPSAHDAAAFGADRTISFPEAVVIDTLEQVRVDTLNSGESRHVNAHGPVWFDAGIGGAFGPDISGILLGAGVRFVTRFGSIEVEALAAFQLGAFFEQALDKITEVRILYGYHLDIVNMRLLFSGGFASLSGDVLREGISYHYGVSASGAVLEARIFLLEHGTVYPVGVQTSVTLTDEARWVEIALVFAF
jgi:hypothetical protein